MALFQSQFCSTATYPQTNAGDPISLLALQDFMTSERTRRAQQQPVGRESSTCTQVIWIFFWLIVLIVFAYPIAIVAGFFYAITNPLNLLECFHAPMKVLLAALNFPLTCARNIIEAKQLIVM